MQLHNIEVFILIHKNKLSKKQIKDALRAMSVIKEKRDRTLKGRACADSSKQKWWYAKAEIASSIVHTYSVMLTSAIDTFEDIILRTGDIKGVCLHVLQDDFMVIYFAVEQVSIMCSIRNKYYKHEIIEKEKKILCLILAYSLYSCTKSALLWCNLLTLTLLNIGFKLN